MRGSGLGKLSPTSRHTVTYAKPRLPATLTRCFLTWNIAMADRHRLPNRRASETFTFELDGLRFTATVSRFPDGRLGELFLSNHKNGNQLDTFARDSAVILSFAVQHGADIDVIRRALCRDSQGRALGPIGAALDVIGGWR
jgi:hypothetical protein